jgi:sortase A
MKARVLWKNEELWSEEPSSQNRWRPLPRRRAERRGLRALEWVFLLTGLLALDCFVWINTSSVLYQAYQDWAFDQTLRGLTPGVGGFVRDETRWLLGGGREKAQAPEVPQELAPAPGEAPNEVRPPTPSVIGRLEIPRLGLAVMVREGADEGTLSRAVGHIPGTALPGNVGNVGLAGHRDTFFRALRNIHADDTIDLETTAGTYHYLVKSTRIVTPRDVSVLEASGGESLTLVTCYPFYYVGSAPKRFIVHAKQVAPIPRRQPPHSPTQGS